MAKDDGSEILRLQSKRQLNVQEQNALVRARILRIAAKFRDEKESFKWVRSVLSLVNLDPEAGILVSESAVQCGDGAEAAYAHWFTLSGRLLEIEATILSPSGELESLDKFVDTSDTDGMRSRRGRGKTLGCLAMEVASEVLGSNYAFKPTAEQALRIDRGALRRGGLTRR